MFTYIHIVRVYLFAAYIFRFMFCIRFYFSFNPESLCNIFALHGAHVAHRYVESFRKHLFVDYANIFRKVLKYLIKRYLFDNISNFFIPKYFLFKLKIKIKILLR